MARPELRQSLSGAPVIASSECIVSHICRALARPVGERSRSDVPATNSSFDNPNITHPLDENGVAGPLMVLLSTCHHMPAR